MPDQQKVDEIKAKMLAFVASNGPSLPVQINKAVEVDSLFGAAFLSEILNEKKVKISHMKVGSSPVYYLEEQTPLLEKYVGFLNHKEKEAFYLLKEKILLNDEDQLPPIRVALRAIKDFAIPIRARIGTEEKSFWKYFQATEEQVKEKLEEFTNKKAPEVVETKKEEPEQIEAELENKETEKIIEIEKAPFPKQEPEEQKEIKQVKEKIKKPQKEPQKFEFSLNIGEQPLQIKEDSPFLKTVKHFLSKREISLNQIIKDEKKEVLAKVSINTILGNQTLFLVAKDKKRIKQEELFEALKEAHSQKLPCLLIAPGELEKKATLSLQEWGNLIKFERLK